MSASTLSSSASTNGGGGFGTNRRRSTSAAPSLRIASNARACVPGRASAGQRASASLRERPSRTACTAVATWMRSWDRGREVTGESLRARAGKGGPRTGQERRNGGTGPLPAQSPPGGTRSATIRAAPRKADMPKAPPRSDARSEAELAALPASERIRYRLVGADCRYHANDNIASYIKEGELLELKSEVQEKVQELL